MDTKQKLYNVVEERRKGQIIVLYGLLTLYQAEYWLNYAISHGHNAYIVEIEA